MLFNVDWTPNSVAAYDVRAWDARVGLAALGKLRPTANGARLACFAPTLAVGREFDRRDQEQVHDVQFIAAGDHHAPPAWKELHQFLVRNRDDVPSPSRSLKGWKGRAS